ncbi:MAG: peptidase M4, partial [Gammaproteobacteria bacterium]|nr:peptidase M4 [Gammaproteobacteria bacterium]
MKTRIMQAAGATTLLAISLGVLASERLDHDEVKRLRETGQILSMNEVMASAQSVQPGQMVEAELEREHGAYRYEIKILAS